jgi:pimeloyl-ACP methyl ester carboxylesterase
MSENPFQLELADGALSGHTGGRGAPALLLHGGPGMPDYLEGCAAELGDLFTTIRYTQRGTLPSTVGAPYSVESHMADALAVLDAFGLERAWAVGHSWGGHLALHLAVAHPDRLYGIACIDPLGASLEVLDDYEQAVKEKLPPGDLARSDEIDARVAAGEATEEELVEQTALLWPAWFSDPGNAPPCPVRNRGVACSTETFASLREQFERGTLASGLPGVRMPALFVHGIDDPLPLRASLDTARLIPGARVARIPRCGHYPWLEQPGFVNRSLRGLIAQL